MGVEEIMDMIEAGECDSALVSANKKFINDQVTYQTPKGYPILMAPLHSVCLDGGLGDVVCNMAELLLENGALIELEQKDFGFHPLHQAAMTGDPKLVALLIDKGALVNSFVFGSCTPLTMAINSLQYENAELLRKHNGTTDMPVFNAAESGDLKRVQEIIRENPAQILATNDEDIRGVDGNSALHYAARGPDRDPNSSTIKMIAPSRVPSRDQIMTKQKDVVDFLCKNGANVNAQNVNGVTPLFNAASEGFYEIIKVLTDYDADINIPNNDNATPLVIAAFAGHVETVKLLLDKGTDSSVVTVRGNTALKLAINGGHREVVDLLMQHQEQYRLQQNAAAEIIALQQAEVKQKRRDQLEQQRRSQGVCIMCGKSLGFLDKLTRLPQHRGCVQFSDLDSGVE